MNAEFEKLLEDFGNAAFDCGECGYDSPTFTTDYPQKLSAFEVARTALIAWVEKEK